MNLPDRLDEIAHKLLATKDYSPLAHAIYQAAIELRASPSHIDPCSLERDLTNAKSILQLFVDAASEDKLEDFSRLSNVADLAADFLRCALAPSATREAGKTERP